VHRHQLLDTVPTVAGELRHCMENAGLNETIDFSGSGTITLTAQLPGIDGSQAGLTIDGGGDVGIDASGTTGSVFVLNEADDVTLVGLTIGVSDASGVYMVDSTDITIGGDGVLANALVDHDESGIRIDSGCSNVLIRRNRVGLTFSNAASGTCQNASTECAGIQVLDGSTGIDLEYNVVGASGDHGILVESTGTTVFGNRVGTDTTGTADQGNAGDGILVAYDGVSPITGVVVESNVVVANEGHGIHVAGDVQGATVKANYVGLSTGYLPLGNDGDGVHVAGGASHTIGGTGAGDGNRIGANGGSGVYAAATLLDAGLTALTVDGNHIGIAPGGTTDLGNAGYGVRLSLPVDPAGTTADIQHIGSATVGNTISGNDLGGVFVAAANVEVRGNVIGLDDAGDTTVANGTLGGTLPALSVGGVRVVAPLGPGGGPIVIDDNVVSGNHGNGLWLSRATFAAAGVAPRQIDVTGNVVGTTVDTLSARANTGDGVRVVGLTNVWLDDNLVAHSGGAGIAIEGALNSSLVLGGSAAGNEVTRNHVHDNAGHGVRLGHAGGVRQRAPVVNNLVDGNTIEANGGAGIYSVGVAHSNELTENVITGNAQCAILDEYLADTAPVVSAPYAKTVTGGGIGGVVDVLGGSLDRIEVYERDDGSFIGSVAAASMTGNQWSLPGTPPSGVLTPDDVSALAILTDGTTSEMTKYEGDGCVPASCTPTGEELNGCQVWWVDPALGCQSAVRPEGYRCDDGEHLTGMINVVLDDDESWLYQDACDGNGSCVAGTDLTDTNLLAASGDACPWKTACNSATVDPEGCTYDAVNDTADPTCGIDDMHCNGQCGDTVCTDCDQLDPTFDIDLNLNDVPDAWELGDFDHDCDSATPVATQIGEGEVTSVSATVTPLYVFVAYMDMALNVDDDGNPLHTNAIHSHHLDPTLLDEIEQTFQNQDIQLVVEQVAIPHYTLVSDIRQNWDADCNDVYDFATLDDLKARHFPQSKRGSYHFVLMAHHDAPARDEANNLDGICSSRHQYTGKAELKGGDDARVVFAGGIDSDPSSPAANYAETKIFIHELGHLLSLQHGGASSVDNQAPNYQSVMNYRYQWHLSTVSAPGYAFDFSHEATPLDETELYEADGLQVTVPLADRKTVTWDCGPGTKTTGKGSPGTAGSKVALDWNCDGATDAAGVDTRADISGKDGRKNMAGYDDWTNVDHGLVCNLAGRRDWVDVGNETEAEPANVHPLEWLDATVDAAPSCSGDEVPLDDVVPVEVIAYGDSDWAASDVVLGRTRFGGAPPLEAEISDRDSDGHDDVTFYFRSSEMTLLTANSGYAIFNAHLDDGRALYAQPTVAPGTYVDADANGILDTCEGP
jgi:hypothetical protein